MASLTSLSWRRTLAVFVKEFQQMLRDRLTFGMAVGVPVLQLLLFGYAINTDPKGLPTALVVTDAGPMARSIVAALQNTGYFRIVHTGTSEAEGEALIEHGTAQFLVVIPTDFSRRVVRGERPALLVSVDATDPSASGNAIAALNGVAGLALEHDLVGPLRTLQPGAAPYEVRVHRRYNPEGLSRYNIVPGLIGTILTMTMVMLTSLAMTRERERGTMENLLATPVQPARGDGRQDPALRGDRLRAAGRHPGRRMAAVRGADGRQLHAADGDDRGVHRRQPGRGLHVLHARAQPVAGDADDVLLLPAVDAAVGIHVPVPRHARAGRSGSARCCR